MPTAVKISDKANELLERLQQSNGIGKPSKTSIIERAVEEYAKKLLGKNL